MAAEAADGAEITSSRDEVSLRGQLGGQGESVVHLEVGLYVKVLIF